MPLFRILLVASAMTWQCWLSLLSTTATTLGGVRAGGTGGSDNDGPARPTLHGLYTAYARQLELQPPSDRQGRMDQRRNKSPLHATSLRALALREVALGPGHFAVGTPRQSRGVVSSAGPIAEPLLRRVLEIPEDAPTEAGHGSRKCH